MTAHLPDNQWDLVQQSLRASGNDSHIDNVPAAVVVEAGILVSIRSDLALLTQMIYDVLHLQHAFSKDTDASNLLCYMKQQWQQLFSGLLQRQVDARVSV